MYPELYTENIGDNIQHEISKAQESIFIAVAWFTNKQIFNRLLKKANEGCKIRLMITDDQINANSSIDYDELNINNSKVYLINEDVKRLHHKFCVIDHSTVITGSYNYSYKAESNYENILVFKNAGKLAEEFITEFNRIANDSDIEESVEHEIIPYDIIHKRLQIIQTFISLGEIDSIQNETSKIKNFIRIPELKNIIDSISIKAFGTASKLIQEYLQQNSSIQKWKDPRIEAFQLEITILENQIVALDNEKQEMERQLSDFKRRHTLELGEVITRILKLRKLKFKNDQEKFKEAEQDEKEYTENVETEKQKEVFNLSSEQEKELGKLYRKAAHLCHPDKFNNEPIEIQNQANELMQQLAKAKDKKDIELVKQILTNLENGNLKLEKQNNSNDIDKLENLITLLKQKLEKITQEIIEIKDSKPYQTIIAIKDFDIYFEDLKAQLEDECESLTKELESRE